MAEQTGIGWCDSTFNPVIGCQEVSPACDFCWARTQNEFRKWVDGWGPHGERKRTSIANWKKPHQWQRNAGAFHAEHGRRQRVFAPSMADPFDKKWPEHALRDFFALIRVCPDIDWLLLTKRPQNIAKMLPDDWARGYQNVWLGVSAENQEEFDRRWQHLRDAPSVVKFISYEPALGTLTLPADFLALGSGAWMIAGAESGSHRRPMPNAWARGALFQCQSGGVPFFMKQLTGRGANPITDMALFPLELRVQQFPTPSPQGGG